MKIRIIRETTDQYFAEVVGQPGVHAVASTPELVVEYLFDVYEQVHLVKKDNAQKKLLLDRSFAGSHRLHSSFKSLTVTL